MKVACVDTFRCVFNMTYPQIVVTKDLPFFILFLKHDTFSV